MLTCIMRSPREARFRLDNREGRDKGDIQRNPGQKPGTATYFRAVEEIGGCPGLSPGCPRRSSVARVIGPGGAADRRFWTIQQGCGPWRCGCGAGGGKAWQVPHAACVPSTIVQMGAVFVPPEACPLGNTAPWHGVAVHEPAA